MDELAVVRLDICRECGMSDVSSSSDSSYLICSDKRWIDSDTFEVYDERVSGAKRGCGCVLSRKVLNRHSTCIVGKW